MNAYFLWIIKKFKWKIEKKQLFSLKGTEFLYRTKWEFSYLFL